MSYLLPKGGFNMEDLFSKDENIIIKTVIEIYKNPENYTEHRREIITRLLELSDYRIDFRFPYYPEYCNAGSLRNIAFMALISLYIQNPSSEDLNPIQILEYFINKRSMGYKDLFEFPEFKFKFDTFLKDYLVKAYSKELFLMVIQYIAPRVAVRMGLSTYNPYLGRGSSTVRISAFLELIESWFTNPDINPEISDEWYFFTSLLTEFENKVKEKFVNMLLNLLKQKKYKVLCFYSYIEEFLINETLKTEFKNNIPNNTELPGIDTFLKAENLFVQKQFHEAVKVYSQIPETFPRIESILQDKLYTLSKEVGDYFLLGNCLRNLIKIQEGFTKHASITFQDSVIKPNIKGFLEELAKSSDYILMEKGKPCKFCSNYISPNADFCPKCGEPNN